MKSIHGALLVLILSVGASAQEAAGPLPPQGTAAAVDGAGQRVKNASEPKSIDAMIAAALRSNPDVLVAEAKVREAEAELNRVRMKVTQDVMALGNRREATKLALDAAESSLQRKTQMHQAGTLDAGAYEEARFALLRARHDVAAVETEVRYLLGDGPGKVARPTDQNPSKDSAPLTQFVTRPRRGSPERVFLNEVITLSVKESSLPTIFEQLKPTASQHGMMIVVDEEISEITLSLEVKEITIDQFLTLLTDRMSDTMAFVFRPYGMFVTTPRNAQRLWGPSIPVELPVMRAAQPPEDR